MEHDLILHGIHLGEHSIDPEGLIEEIRCRVIEPGLNFVTIRTGYKFKRPHILQHYFLEWARFLAEHRIYFALLYTVQYAPEGRSSALDRATVDQMKQIAGEYFLGDTIGEVGSSIACKLPGYFTGAGRRDNTPIRTDYPDLAAAHKGYVQCVSAYTDIDRALGLPGILSVEATALSKYNAEAGVTVPILEMMCGNPELLVSSLRGTARAMGAKLWGTYVAHEWYGGMRHEDPLKIKRLELTYKYAYLAGSQIFCLESGDECIQSYGQTHGKDSALCQDYRRVLAQMADFIREDRRPSGGPKVTAAFVSGRFDGWGGWGGSALWNQFHRPQWGYGEAEYSWRIPEELGVRRGWADIANYGNEDLSANPAYGLFDIVPIEADTEVLCRYDRLIFLGWNSMTEENMGKLTEFVRRGGQLLMTAAHLNTAETRDGPWTPPSEAALEALFGCRFTGETELSNNGIKFCRESLAEEHRYPFSGDLDCDPIYSAGYLRWGKFAPTEAQVTATLADSFACREGGLPAVLEHRLGAGVATLVTSLQYPGAGALLPLYWALTREMITAGVRSCPLKVLGSDRIRWACYGSGKLYLLNTDYDLPAPVRVRAGDRELQLTLEPLELKTLEVSQWITGSI